MKPVRDKTQMYADLAAGRFGNTVPQYFTVAEWRASREHGRCAFWGVRTMTAGGKCRLFCPRDEVASTVESFAPHAVSIGVMIDCLATVRLMCEVWQGVGGTEAYGVEDPGEGANWRQVMPTRGRHYALSAASHLLQRRLNGNSLSDLRELLELYPGHVVELSACEEEVGTVPGRNAVVWEVRYQGEHCTPGGGSYERNSWGFWR